MQCALCTIIFALRQIESLNHIYNRECIWMRQRKKMCINNAEHTTLLLWFTNGVCMLLFCVALNVMLNKFLGQCLHWIKFVAECFFFIRRWHFFPSYNLRHWIVNKIRIARNPSLLAILRFNKLQKKSKRKCGTAWNDEYILVAYNRNTNMIHKRFLRKGTVLRHFLRSMNKEKRIVSTAHRLALHS